MDDRSEKTSFWGGETLQKTKNHLISFWSHDKKDKRVYVEK
jgi:hypothetical protein